jgi:hypothetical protein
MNNVPDTELDAMIEVLREKVREIEEQATMKMIEVKPEKVGAGD